MVGAPGIPPDDAVLATEKAPPKPTLEPKVAQTTPVEASPKNLRDEDIIPCAKPFFHACLCRASQRLMDFPYTRGRAQAGRSPTRPAIFFRTPRPTFSTSNADRNPACPTFPVCHRTLACACSLPATQRYITGQTIDETPTLVSTKEAETGTKPLVPKNLHNRSDGAESDADSGSANLEPHTY